MAFKVIETIIQNKLILSQQTERSKNFYVRYCNSLNKSYSYKSLRTNKLKEARKKSTLKIQYGNYKRCYTGDEMFQFYN
jgi:hypothetical protein